MARKQPNRSAPNTPPGDLRTDPDRGTGELGFEDADPGKPLEKSRQEQKQSQGRKGRERG